MKRAQMSRFPIHDDETAPEGSAALLKSASSTAGQLPNLLGVLGGSPAVLRAFLRFRQELRRGELAPATRARMAVAVAAHFGSEPHLAAQERAAQALGIALDEIGRARRWRSSDPAEAALLRWLEPLLTKRGQVPAHVHEEALEAGWTHAQLLEAAAAVALDSFTAQITIAGEVPPDGSAEEGRQLRAVA